MSGTCQFHSEAQPECARRALPGKEFCGPHSRVAGSMEELVETIALGPGTAEEIAERLAIAETAAEPVKPAKSKKAPRAAAAADPETLGSQIAEKLVAMEVAARTERALARQRTRHRREDGTELPAEGEAGQPTFTVRPRRARADTTRMVGEDGKSLVKPGWVPRWVRNVDHMNRATEARVEDFKDFGYEPVIDPGTGKPLTSLYGIAMQAPPQQYALRVKEYSAPGALNPNDLYEDTRVAIDELNHEAGEPIVHLVEEPGHKTTRKWHGLAPEA